MKYEGAWYELVELEGLSMETVRAHCVERHGNSAEKRFAEDLPQVLGEMGRAASQAVQLVLRRVDDGVLVREQAALMTRENRRLVYEARRAREGGPRRAEAAAEPHARLLRPDVENDLRQLLSAIDTRFAYAGWRDPAYADRFEKAIESLPESLETRQLAVIVQKLLSPFGDGHAGIEDLDPHLGDEFCPFLLFEDASGNVVGVDQTRTRLLDPKRPFVVAIDGVPITRWLEAARTLVTRGSPALIRHRAPRYLRWIQHFRRELGLPATDTIRVALAAAPGHPPAAAATADLTVMVTRQKPIFGVLPREGSRLLPGDIGYLRLATMQGDEAFVVEALRRFDDFRRARALIIDVRGNSGGSRELLRRLLPLILPPASPPRVVNISATRLLDEQDQPEDGLLANRFLFPLRHPAWSQAEQAALARALRDFRAEWSPTAPPARHQQQTPTRWSDWHAMVVSPGGGPGFESPVVVLQDGGCFSATDVFLGACKGLPNVTLIGSPSSGGSGRAFSLTLLKSGLRVRLSSMASFRPDGALYDGRGIQPDVVMEPTFGDLIGASDTVLEAATAYLEQLLQAKP
ncbi:MAG: S41 family peptidase [Planctomycetota bacterium]|nr:S41 family peptidase [Planctomycetota bacterium]